VLAAPVADRAMDPMNSELDARISPVTSSLYAELITNSYLTSTFKVKHLVRIMVKSGICSY